MTNTAPKPTLGPSPSGRQSSSLPSSSISTFINTAVDDEDRAKETKTTTATNSTLNQARSFQFHDGLKSMLVASLMRAFDETEPSQSTNASTPDELGPEKEIAALESWINKHYSVERQIALKQLNKPETMVPFLQKLNSMSKNDLAGKITELLLLSLQLATFPVSPTVSSPFSKRDHKKSRGADSSSIIKLPSRMEGPLPSIKAEDTDGSDYEYAELAGEEPSTGYKHPGSAARRVSFTHTIGQPAAGSATPAKQVSDSQDLTAFGQNT